MPVRATPRINEADAGAQLLLGPGGAEVGAIIDGVVTPAAGGEGDADVESFAGRLRLGAGGAKEEEGDVSSEEGGEDELSQEGRKRRRGWVGGKGGIRGATGEVAEARTGVRAEPARRSQILQ